MSFYYIFVHILSAVMPGTNRNVLNAQQSPDELINQFAGIHEMLGAAVVNVAA